MTILMRKCLVCSVEKEWNDDPFIRDSAKSGFKNGKCWSCYLIHHKNVNRKTGLKMVTLDTGEQVTKATVARRKLYQKIVTLETGEQLKYLAARSRRIREDPDKKFWNGIHTLLNSHLKLGGYTKSARLHEYLGCSIQDLRYHLEDLFTPEMTWENHGSYWHIDHILPLSAARNHEEAKQLWHWTNLQPLERGENIRKRNQHCPEALAAFLASRSVQSPNNYIVNP